MTEEITVITVLKFLALFDHGSSPCLSEYMGLRPLSSVSLLAHPLSDNKRLPSYATLKNTSTLMYVLLQLWPRSLAKF